MPGHGASLDGLGKGEQTFAGHQTQTQSLINICLIILRMQAEFLSQEPLYGSLGQLMLEQINVLHTVCLHSPDAFRLHVFMHSSAFRHCLMNHSRGDGLADF